MRRNLFHATALALPLVAAAAPPALATIVFQTGNQQYTNVNIAADTNAMTIIGDIGNTGVQMTFNTMIGPDGTAQVEMHGQNGVAYVESYADSLTSTNNHTGFSSITLTPEAGYGFTAGDFKLDQLNSLAAPSGTVTFAGEDHGVPEAPVAMSIAQTGQNPYNFYTLNGELVTSLTITVPTTDLLVDIAQVSVGVAEIPEPSSLAVFAGGLGLLALAAHRPWKRAARRA